jgi:predicted nucleotidyltransferase
MSRDTVTLLPRAVRRNIDSIAAGYLPKRIVVYGSFARGDQHQGSDLDLIVIKNTTEKFADRIEHVLRYHTGGIAVEPLVYTEKELARMISQGNSFLQNALAEGIVVYEQQS